MNQRRTLATLLLILTVLPCLALPGAARADDPPAPTERHLYRVAGLPASRPDGGRHLRLEFPPGAPTPPHTHPGLTLATVLEGEVTFDTAGTKKTYRVGESFTERPGDVGVAANTGATRTRVMASIILPKGAAPSTPQPGGPSPAPPAPTALYLYRTAALDPRRGVRRGPAGARLRAGGADPGPHAPWSGRRHRARGGEHLRHRGQATVYKTGESFVELPGVVGQARNAGNTPMAVMATFLLPRGAPLSHPVTTAAACPAEPAGAAWPPRMARRSPRSSPPSRVRSSSQPPGERADRRVRPSASVSRSVTRHGPARLTRRCRLTAWD